jgi:hypothetical protein
MLAQINKYLINNPREALYELTSGQTFEVVDFEKAVAGLKSQFDIDRYLAVTNTMNGEWSSLKYPAPIQLIARWLTEQSELNGIVFNSTVDEGKRNVAWFVADDISGANLFQYKELSRRCLRR